MTPRARVRGCELNGIPCNTKVEIAETLGESTLKVQDHRVGTS